jgi:hypothetical protein
MRGCRSACGGLLARCGLGMRWVPLLGGWLRGVAENPHGGDKSEALAEFVQFVVDNLLALNGNAWREEQFPEIGLQLVTE